MSFHVHNKRNPVFKVCNNGPASDGVNKATREDIDPVYQNVFNIQHIYIHFQYYYIKFIVHRLQSDS